MVGRKGIRLPADMGVTCTNFPRFTAALRSVSAVSKKSQAEIVTRACRDVGFRAAQFTPFATPAKIEAELMRDRILVKTASMALNREKGPGKWTRADLVTKANAILKKRRSGTKALRAGWIPGILALGGSYRGAKVKPGGSGAQGTGKKATPTNLRAMIRNSIATISAAGIRTTGGDIPVATRALNQAIEFVSADREIYVAKKRMSQQIAAAIK